MEKVNFDSIEGRIASVAFYTTLLQNGPVPGTNALDDAIPRSELHFPIAAGQKVKWITTQPQHHGSDIETPHYGTLVDPMLDEDGDSSPRVREDSGTTVQMSTASLIPVGKPHPSDRPQNGMELLQALHVLKQTDNGLTVPEDERDNVTRLLNRMLALDPDVQNGVYNYYYDIFQQVVADAIARGTLDTGVRSLPGDEFDFKEPQILSTDQETGADTVYQQIDAKVRTHRQSLKDLEEYMAPELGNTRLVVNPKGRVAVIRDAHDVIHGDTHAHEPGVYFSTPASGRRQHRALSSLSYQDLEPWAQEEVDNAESALEKAKDEKERQESRLTQAKEQLADEKESLAEIKSGASTRYTISSRPNGSFEVKGPGPNGGSQGTRWAMKEAEQLRDRLATRDAENRESAIERINDRITDIEKNITEASEPIKGLEEEVAKAKEIQKDPKAWALHQWQEQYDAAPQFNVVPHHLISGAVFKFWNPIRAASGFGNIYTASNPKTKQRVVGVDIPTAGIRGLIARITGGASTVDAHQLIADVLENNLHYTLEGGIEVQRGRINRENVITLSPPNDDISENLISLGVRHQAGAMDVYFIPNNWQGDNSTKSIVERILAQYPVVPEAGPAQPMPSRTSTGKLQMSADIRGIAGGMASSLYEGDGPQIVLRELIQNAADAIRPSNSDNRALPGGQGIVKVVFNRGDNTITVNDNGRGLTRDEIFSVFSDLGSSGKRANTEASGGFGIGQAAPFLRAANMHVDTTARADDGKYYRSTFDSTPDAILDGKVDVKTVPISGTGTLGLGDPKTGTIITVGFDKNDRLYPARGFADRLADSAKFPGRLIVDDGDGKPKEVEVDKPAKYENLGSEKVGGSIIDILASTKKTVLGKILDFVEVKISNNGVYQFSTFVHVPESGKIAEVPESVIVDIKPQVSEGSPKYPFTLNRERLRDDGEVKAFIDKAIYEKIIAPKLKSTTTLLAERYKQIGKLSNGVAFYDEGRRLDPDERKSLEQNTGFLALTGAITKHAEIMRAGLEELKPEELGLSPWFKPVGEQKKIERIGIVFGNVHGMWVPNPEKKGNGSLFLNPFSGFKIKGKTAEEKYQGPLNHASRLDHTILHELFHTGGLDHGEAMEIGMTNAIQYLAAEIRAGIADLEGALSDPGNPRAINPEVKEALRIYQEAAGRESRVPDILGRKEQRIGQQPASRSEVSPEKALQRGGETAIPERGEGTTLYAGLNPVAAVKALAAPTQKLWDLYANLPKWTNFKDILGHFQGQIQLGDWESEAFLKHFRDEVPSRARRQAMYRWIEAAGDDATLQHWEQNGIPESQQKYKDARNLTPEEEAWANTLKGYLDQQGQKATNAGLIEGMLEDYVPHIVARHSQQQMLLNRLKSEINGGVLVPNPFLTKKRIFPTAFALEAAGYKLRNDDLGWTIAVYDGALNRAIASRVLLKALTKEKAPDGRSLAAGAGSGRQIQGGDDESNPYLVYPNTPPKGAGDYKGIDNPALRKWKYVDEDAQGNPIFVQGDLRVHPTVYAHLDNILGKSWFRYDKPGASLPVSALKSTLRGAMAVQQEIKGTVFAFAFFHQYQTGRHATIHGVNPFNTQDIDLHNPLQMSLVNHGLLVADSHTQQMFEDVASKGLLNRIPYIGTPLENTKGLKGKAALIRYGGFLQLYSHYLFQDLIPRLKMAMAVPAYEHNMKSYFWKKFAVVGDEVKYIDANGKERVGILRGHGAKDNAGIENPKTHQIIEVPLNRILHNELLELTAKEANNAFGGQNLIMLGRNKTFQDFLNLSLVAPDFGESRIKFTGQALRPFGKEQRRALFFYGALLTATIAYILDMLQNHKHDWTQPFSFRVGDRIVSERTVFGDDLHMLADPRGFAYFRLNTLSKAAGEAATGKDYAGFERDLAQQATDAVRGGVPIPAQGLFRPHGQPIWETIVNSLGWRADKYYTPAEKKAMELRRGNVHLAAPTPEAQGRSKVKSELLDKFREDQPSFRADANRAIQAGQITQSDMNDIEKKGKDMLISDVKMMRVEDAIEVYKKADEDEKKRIGQIIREKAFRSLGKRPPREARAIQQKMFDVGLTRFRPTPPSVEVPTFFGNQQPQLTAQ